MFDIILIETAWLVGIYSNRVFGVFGRAQSRLDAQIRNHRSYTTTMIGNLTYLMMAVRN